MAAPTQANDIGNLKAAHAARLKESRGALMSERLTRLHELCKQMSAIKGSAAAH
ncbi:MAG TPA: hypothetical protein VK471_00905 [Solirubrobacterales bacterium]|nr:hypothetical protein [Solirubrobacterales bacterium]